MVGSLQNQMIYLSLEFLTIGLGILSNNYLNDQTVTNFIEVIIPECINLKSLNLSSNQITHKSLKILCDLVNSNKFSNKSNSMVIIKSYFRHFFLFLT